MALRQLASKAVSQMGMRVPASPLGSFAVRAAVARGYATGEFFRLHALQALWIQHQGAELGMDRDVPIEAGQEEGRPPPVSLCRERAGLRSIR